MATMLISFAVTAVIASLFYAWLSDRRDRRVRARLQWAGSAGWRLRSAPAGTTLPASWPEYPPAEWGKPETTVEGECDDYPLVLEWIADEGEWAATVCYITLRQNHPTSTAERRLFARRLPPPERHTIFGSMPGTARDVLSATSVDALRLSGQHLVAARHVWLKPDQIDTFLREVLAVSAAVDSYGPAMPGR